jgi:hypothetical protein
VTKGIGSHTRAVRGATDCWLTPPEIVVAMGPLDLGPCAGVVLYRAEEALR